MRGLDLFKGKARCILCHNGPNFTDNKFHNLGVPQVGPNNWGSGFLPTVYQGVPFRGSGDPVGAIRITNTRTDEILLDHTAGRFLSSGSTRRVGGELTASFDIVLGLTPEEKTDLVEFLKALTGAPLKVTMPKLPK